MDGKANRTQEVQFQQRLMRDNSWIDRATSARVPNGTQRGCSIVCHFTVQVPHPGPLSQIFKQSASEVEPGNSERKSSLAHITWVAWGDGKGNRAGITRNEWHCKLCFDRRRASLVVLPLTATFHRVARECTANYRAYHVATLGGNHLLWCPRIGPAAHPQTPLGTVGSLLGTRGTKKCATTCGRVGRYVNG